MNQIDINRLEQLNARYGGGILTGFKLVTGDTRFDRVVEDIKCDVKILNTTQVDYKYVYTIIVRDDVIDIRSRDNGTVFSYFFTSDARFTTDDVAGQLGELCDDENIILDIK